MSENHDTKKSNVNVVIKVLAKNSKTNYENKIFNFSKKKKSLISKDKALGREDLLKYIKEEKINVVNTGDLKNIINGSKDTLGEGKELFIDFMAEVLYEYYSIINKNEYGEAAKNKINQVFSQILNEETFNNITEKINIIRLRDDRKEVIKKTGMTKETMERDLEEMANKAARIKDEKNRNTAAETNLAIKTIDKSLNAEQQQGPTV